MSLAMDSVKATVAGAICGAIFTLLKLPIPAPPVLSGIMGIVGVWLGHVGVQRLLTGGA